MGTRYIFACQSNERVYLRQNGNFSQLLFAAIFLLNNVIGAVLSKERWMVPIDCIPLRFTVSYRAD